MKQVYVQSILAILFSILSFKVSACDQSRQIPKNVIDQADKIIIARAIESQWSSENEDNLASRIVGFYRRISSPGKLSKEGWTRFEVKRVLKGRPVEYVRIEHNVSESACGVTFNPNDKHLIFMHEDDGRFVTSIFGVRPLMSTQEYHELLRLLDVSDADDIKVYKDYLAPFSTE